MEKAISTVSTVNVPNNRICAYSGEIVPEGEEKEYWTVADQLAMEAEVAAIEAQDDEPKRDYWTQKHYDLLADPKQAEAQDKLAGMWTNRQYREEQGDTPTWGFFRDSIRSWAFNLDRSWK